MAKQGKRHEVVSAKRVERSGTGKKIGVRLLLQDLDTGASRERVLLNPNGKGRKYAHELRVGVRYTNDGKFKKDADGNVQKLTDAQRAYRGGYLDAQRDSARAYNSKQRKK